MDLIEKSYWKKTQIQYCVAPWSQFKCLYVANMPFSSEIYLSSYCSILAWSFQWCLAHIIQESDAVPPEWEALCADRFFCGIPWRSEQELLTKQLVSCLAEMFFPHHLIWQTIWYLKNYFSPSKSLSVTPFCSNHNFPWCGMLCADCMFCVVRNCQNSIHQSMLENIWKSCTGWLNTAWGFPLFCLFRVY